jgi:hypothetical protein
LVQRQRGQLNDTAPTDAGTLTVTAITQNGQWKVDQARFRAPAMTTDPQEPQPKPGSGGAREIKRHAGVDGQGRAQGAVLTNRSHTCYAACRYFGDALLRRPPRRRRQRQ